MPKCNKDFVFCLSRRLRCGRKLAVLLMCAFAFVASTFSPAASAEAPTFTVGWSVYAGWNPYFYMQKSGILKKWADKYGIVIKVQRFDYAASLDSFVAKNIDACAMTNMEALDMPAAAGRRHDRTDRCRRLLQRQRRRPGPQRPHLRHARAATASCWCRRPSPNTCWSAAMVLSGQQAKLGSLKLLNTSDSDIAPAFLNNRFQRSRRDLEAPGLADPGTDKNVFIPSSIPRGSRVRSSIFSSYARDVLNRPDGSGASVSPRRSAAPGTRPCRRLTTAGPATGGRAQDQRRRLRRLGRLVPRSS